MNSLFREKKTKSKWSIEASKNSKLNELVKYSVEIDKDMDKITLQKLEQELDIILPLLNGIILPDMVNHIRLRKFTPTVLGRFHPLTKTILININTNGGESLLHELGHSLDEYLGTISESVEFKKIVSLYVENYLNVNKYKKLRKNTIYYNINNPHEIFANSFRYYILKDLIEKDLKENNYLEKDNSVIICSKRFTRKIAENRVGTEEYILHSMKKEIIEYFDNISHTIPKIVDNNRI